MQHKAQGAAMVPLQNSVTFAYLEVSPCTETVEFLQKKRLLLLTLSAYRLLALMCDRDFERTICKTMAVSIQKVFTGQIRDQHAL